MVLYFCLRELLDELEKAPGSSSAAEMAITVYADLAGCQSVPDDSFVIERTWNILTFEKPEPLAAILKEIPLYRVNLELLLDDALRKRHENKAIETALKAAFGGQPLPSTLPQKTSPVDMGGNLFHPVLAHMDHAELSRLYGTFLVALDETALENFTFNHIVRQSLPRFFEYFDGYMHTDEGILRLDSLLTSARRCSEQTSEPKETYIQRGWKRGSSTAASTPKELLNAYIVEERFQRDMCRNIDRLLRCPAIEGVPAFVQTDVFLILEHEAAKQGIAAKLVAHPQGRKMLESSRNLKTTMQKLADGQTEETLQQLLAQTLNPSSGYNGTAGRFFDLSSLRIREAESLIL